MVIILDVARPRHWAEKSAVGKLGDPVVVHDVITGGVGDQPRLAKAASVIGGSAEIRL